MEYISCQHMTGGMGRLVHILATKLRSPLSCITPAKYDAKGVEAWRWFILDGLCAMRPATHSRTRRHSIDMIPGSRMCSGSTDKRVRRGCTWSPCLAYWPLFFM